MLLHRVDHDIWAGQYCDINLGGSDQFKRQTILLSLIQYVTVG